MLQSLILYYYLLNTVCVCVSTVCIDDKTCKVMIIIFLYCANTNCINCFIVVVVIVVTPVAVITADVKW